MLSPLPSTRLVANLARGPRELTSLKHNADAPGAVACSLACRWLGAAAEGQGRCVTLFTAIQQAGMPRVHLINATATRRRRCSRLNGCK